MYPLGSLTAALQNARRKLLDVFEPPDSEATRDQRTEGMGKGLGLIGRLTQVKSPTEIPRLKAIVTAILEHGTIPAVALALAIAPANSRGWQRHGVAESTNRGGERETIFSVSSTDTMKLAAGDHEPAISSMRTRSRPVALTVQTTGCAADHRQTN
jgi:hypothetical protein